MRSQSKENAIKFAIRIHPELYDENKEKVCALCYVFFSKQNLNLVLLPTYSRLIGFYIIMIKGKKI